MSLKELRAVLAELGLSTRACIEKGDFVALIAKAFISMFLWKDLVSIYIYI